MLSHGMAQRIEHWPLDTLVAYSRNCGTHSEAPIGQIAARVGAKPSRRSGAVSSILRPCSSPGCPGLAAAGCCGIRRGDQQREPDARCGRTADRGHDADWRRLRALKLATDPVCEIRTRCQGMVAGEVDHKIPIRDAPELRLEWSNPQSSCHHCHAATTGARCRHSLSRRGVGGSVSTSPRHRDQRAATCENPRN
jgi:5-methylcytosine-specific restriction protein A